VHGGVKVYRGSAAAVGNYLDADRSRADDYYDGHDRSRMPNVVVYVSRL
jgi:hypothetical protein